MGGSRQALTLNLLSGIRTFVPAVLALLDARRRPFWGDLGPKPFRV